ncbi:phosphotransferase enzyme family protein [Jannaschia sp. W003]|uniref:phosphotransferase enzyme family protein n=1 Tax=Jannaschia sp. W003 TaxID=2867012 RepID=UPI0021A97592|nr:phosphotransferase [Jannaschia sp. W003]UWQ22244.1 phosphotransferase [Jannaschia sp. W003]
MDGVGDPLLRLARAAPTWWDLPAGTPARLINLSENATFRLDPPGGAPLILRVHRPGYHTRRAIESELLWVDALRASGAPVPEWVPGRDGRAVQEAAVPGIRRRAVLFRHLPGAHPDERGDLVPGFETLGATAARLHAHALEWRRPEPFERLRWDVDAVFGPRAIWGDWRRAPGVTPALRPVLERVEAEVRARLAAYGTAPDRFTLVHADMRLANLLVDGTTTRLIDFDDCGFGWLMYDFAAAISFMEDDPRVPALRAAWLRGYRTVRPLGARDEREIGTMTMLRRMALLAWIGTHMEAPEPQALAPDFAARTARLGTAWLEGRMP